MGYLLLVDVIQAIHLGTVPAYSTKELSVMLPMSPYQFRLIYNSLLHGYVLPKEVTKREDALFLLAAILSDVIYIQNFYFAASQIRSRETRPSGSLLIERRHHLENPFVPFGAESEYSRSTTSLLQGLDRWLQQFQQHVGQDMLVLYYFCRLLLICPQIIRLPRLAGYGNLSVYEFDSRRIAVEKEEIEITDDAMDLAWLILDQHEPEPSQPEKQMCIWLPIALFLPALVIWQRLRCQSSSGRKYGTLKVLKMFKAELEQLPWPCALEMANTLGRLSER